MMVAVPSVTQEVPGGIGAAERLQEAGLAWEGSWRRTVDTCMHPCSGWWLMHALGTWPGVACFISPSSKAHEACIAVWQSRTLRR